MKCMMIESNNYNSIKVELLRATDNPMKILSTALSMTMHKNIKKISHQKY